MKNRYTEIMVTIAAVSTLSVAINVFWRTPSTAHAQSPKPRETCEWTAVVDAYAPNIGKDGKVELKGNWKDVSEGGFKLKAAWEGVYLFERCE